jgi:hypothetical protein
VPFQEIFSYTVELRLVSVIVSFRYRKVSKKSEPLSDYIKNIVTTGTKVGQLATRTLFFEQGTLPIPKENTDHEGCLCDFLPPVLPSKIIVVPL